MKIGLIDIDGHNFPNLPLMKLSAYTSCVIWVTGLMSWSMTESMQTPHIEAWRGGATTAEYLQTASVLRTTNAIINNN